MDDTLARLARALRATPEEPEVADALEAALLRAGRLDEAYLLRWRRGEPSPVAEAVAASQRPTLDALAADPGLATRFCEECGEPACGELPLSLGFGQSMASVRWTYPQEASRARTVEPLVAVRARSPELLDRLRPLATIAWLDVDAGALDRPLPASVERLDLVGERFEARALGLLPELRALGLARCRLTNEGLDGVIQACGDRLERLALQGERLTDDGLEALRAAPRLTSLELRDAPWLDGSGLAAIAESGAPLERIDLSGAHRLTGRAYASLGELSSLREVRLSEALLADDGAFDLAGLPRLRRLELSSATIGPDGLAVLAEAPIEELSLSNLDAFLPDALAQLGAWSRLRRLQLERLGPVCGRTLAALVTAPCLQELELDRLTLIGDDGVLALSRAPRLEVLSLDAPSSVLSLEAVASLARLPRLARLKVQRLPHLAALLAELARAPFLRELTVQPAGLELLDERQVSPLAALSLLEALTVEARLAPGALGPLAAAPSLRRLTLPWTYELEEASLAALAASPTLESLAIRGDHLERARLQAALPRVRVRAA